jgi:hypothetical protein
MPAGASASLWPVFRRSIFYPSEWPGDCAVHQDAKTADPVG